MDLESEIITITPETGICPTCKSILKIKLNHPTYYDEDNGAKIANFVVHFCKKCEYKSSSSFPLSSGYFINSPYIIFSIKLLSRMEKHLISDVDCHGFCHFVKEYNAKHNLINSQRMKLYKRFNYEKYYKPDLDHRRIGDAWIKLRSIQWNSALNLLTISTSDTAIEIMKRKLLQFKFQIFEKFECLNEKKCNGCCGESIFIYFAPEKGRHTKSLTLIYLYASCGRILSYKETSNPELISEYFLLLEEYFESLLGNPTLENSSINLRKFIIGIKKDSIEETQTPILLEKLNEDLKKFCNNNLNFSNISEEEIGDTPPPLFDLSFDHQFHFEFFPLKDTIFTEVRHTRNLMISLNKSLAHYRDSRMILVFNTVIAFYHGVDISSLRLF